MISENNKAQSKMYGNKIYTKLGKLYSIAYLGLVALACAATAIIWVMIARNNTAGSEISLTPIFFLAITVLVAVSTIVGICQEKMWAKWITIAIYSWYIFSIIRVIINAYFSQDIVINITSFKVIHLIALILPILGIILLLQKPKTNVSS
ncbi:hypothetical protein LC608_03130 [Nostoc sp. XA010]|uniref:hypothetical protein n=1 Tax=Nostoc sp. XA010 TaxID=2780407 RepID=UPI001E3C79A1|nr:hypothetical protein [Nostoc sp. XA010]MCC5655993.1 hypothetical protein [Nostoc sp. XA010]